MRKRLITTSVAIAIAFGLSANAYALSITDLGVVGAAEGIAGDNPGTDSSLIAQSILNIVGTLQTTTCQPPATGRTCYSGGVDYSDTIQGPGIKTTVPDDGSNPIVMPAGFKYAIAKYDGQNAGWVLFDLTVFGGSLPADSYSIWGKEGQYRMSGFTVFNPTSVPDGGSAAALLGSALLGLGLLRRRFGRV